ncbi:MAG: hypothetical protein ACKOPG_10420 [Novosphingobium sp.]
MRWSANGAMVPTCILETATLLIAILVTCACGHSASFEPHGLWWHFECRGWDDNLTAAREPFWCRLCSSAKQVQIRPVSLAAVEAAQGDFDLPWPDERARKRATARLR